MNEIHSVERLEMGITHSDYRRILPRLLDDASEQHIDLKTRVRWADGRRLDILVSPEKVRKIALLRMPYVNINFEFQGFTHSEMEAFMVRFDRSFHKGGG